MSPATKAIVLQALQAHRGDDLYRACSAFSGYLDREMDEQYGQSGMTRREVLATYQKNDDAVATAIAEVKAIP